MRDIKFRYVYRNDSGGVKFIDATLEQIEDRTDPLGPFEQHGLKYWIMEDYELDETLQFTGLMDKHGVEIYERDTVIVRLIHQEWERFKIVWESDKARFVLLDKKQETYGITEPCELEVVERAGLPLRPTSEPIS